MKKDTNYKLKFWLVQVWRIMNDSPNLPNFSTAKHNNYYIRNVITKFNGKLNKTKIYVVIFSTEYCVLQNTCECKIFIFINFWQYVAHGKFRTSSLKYITKSNILPYSEKSVLINPLNYEDTI